MAESFWNYLMRITDNASGVAISRAAEVDAGNVSRWKTGKTKPSAETVVKIARRWHRPPVEALVASGHLSPNEVGGVVEVARSLNALTDDELLAEVRRRMEGVRHVLEDSPESDASREAQKTEEDHEVLTGGPFYIIRFVIGPHVGKTLIINQAEFDGAPPGQISVLYELPADTRIVRTDEPIAMVIQMLEPDGKTLLGPPQAVTRSQYQEIPDGSKIDVLWPLANNLKAPSGGVLVDSAFGSGLSEFKGDRKVDEPKETG